MPRERFVLLVVLVTLAAGLTVLIGATVAASAGLAWLGAGALPALLIGYLVVRAIAGRVSSRNEGPNERVGK